VRVIAWARWSKTHDLVIRPPYPPLRLRGEVKLLLTACDRRGRRCLGTVRHVLPAPRSYHGDRFFYRVEPTEMIDLAVESCLRDDER